MIFAISRFLFLAGIGAFVLLGTVGRMADASYVHVSPTGKFVSAIFLSLLSVGSSFRVFVF